MEETQTLTRTCPACGVGTTFRLDPRKVSRWLGGEYIQNVWPDWDENERELLISGTHEACWNVLFGDES